MAMALTGARCGDVENSCRSCLQIGNIHKNLYLYSIFVDQGEDQDLDHGEEVDH